MNVDQLRWLRERKLFLKAAWLCVCVCVCVRARARVCVRARSCLCEQVHAPSAYVLCLNGRWVTDAPYLVTARGASAAPPPPRARPLPRRPRPSFPFSRKGVA